MGLKAQKQHDIKFPDLDSSRTLQPKPRSFLPDSVAGFCMRELQSPSYKSPCGRGHLVAVDTPSHRRWGLQWDRQGVTTQAPHGPPGSPFFPRSRPRVTGSGGRLPPAGTREKGEVEKAAPLQTPRRASASMVGGLVRRGARPSHCQDVLTQKRPPSPESPSSCPGETETNPGI